MKQPAVPVQDDEERQSLLPNEPEVSEVGDEPSKLGSLLYNLCCCCFIHPFIPVACCILLLVLFVPLTAEFYAWNRLSSCHAQQGVGGVRWNAILPPTTMSQKPIKFSQIFYTEVDVFDDSKSNDTKIGYWTNVDMFFGMFRMYAYSDMTTGSERILLQAKQPWFTFRWGKTYKLWLCSETGQSYSIEEDVWAEPWFQFLNPEKIYNIRVADTQQLVGTAKYSRSNAWSLWDAAWGASISAADGTVLSTVQQETLASAGWWSHPRWFSQNFQPSATPNELVSFLAAVYDIDMSRKSSSSHSSSSSRKR